MTVLSERLAAAAKAVEEAGLPDDLRVSAFIVAFWAGRSQGDDRGTDPDLDRSTDRDELLTKHGGEPVDNVLVAAAAWYMDYGSTPFTKADIQDILDSAGMTAPVRIDRTLDTTTKGKGKHLFRKQGRGRWVPSVPGEAYFRGNFGVTKGNKTPERDQS